MENFIDHIHISNFKSIRDLKLEGLSRINLFIGKPNVGKSNILEAFGVFSLPYLKFNSNKKISIFIRLESETELFFDGNKSDRISIETKFFQFSLYYSEKKGATIRRCNIESDKFNIASTFDKKLTVTSVGKELEKNPFKFYIFKPGTGKNGSNLAFLNPPNGSNLLEVVEDQIQLRKEIREIFEEYHLKLVFDKASQELKISKPPQNGEIFLIPYSSIADTLQRVIFHKTAIASNHNSILIFEEPEAHAFPPYISHITHEIIDSKSNQFILSTHSPYVLNDFLENARDELSIFMIDFRGGETVANKLTREDLDDIYGYGIDLFTNYETFLK